MKLKALIDHVAVSISRNKGEIYYVPCYECALALINAGKAVRA